MTEESTTVDNSLNDIEATGKRLLILGANGPTGRETVRQALDRGYEVHALTRHPQNFPITHDRLHVIAGDATDSRTIDAAVAETDAVICALGAKFTLHPVEVYSTSAHLLITSIARHGRRRLIVVTSSGVHPSHRNRGVTEKVSYSLMRNTFAKTVYDDMARMESYVTASDTDWTIVHPPGLTTTPAAGYYAAEGEIEGGFCSRADLAEMLIDQLESDEYLHTTADVTTPGLSLGAIQVFRTEILKR